jgi:hydrogenase expression/formation protein HypD
LKELLLEAGIEMLSGPGCPVCITPNEIHEAAINLVSQKENIILATFGDMTRVPTEKGSLQTTSPSKQSEIKIVYSPQEALIMARQNPHKEVIFFGAGFETTLPAIALTIHEAFIKKINNFSVLAAFWLIPPPLQVIVEDKDIQIDGFLYPGHVSAIIGQEPYRFIPEKFGIAGAIAGFEPVDILLAIISILKQIKSHRPEVANAYTRVVRKDGNLKAREIIQNVLKPKDAFWRGLGFISASGMQIRKKYISLDAEIKYGFNIKYRKHELPGCRCGDVLRGKVLPPECMLFAKKCRPDFPFGPCMVSFEGACLAYYKYGKHRRNDHSE